MTRRLASAKGQLLLSILVKANALQANGHTVSDAELKLGTETKRKVKVEKNEDGKGRMEATEKDVASVQVRVSNASFPNYFLPFNRVVTKKKEWRSSNNHYMKEIWYTILMQVHFSQHLLMCSNASVHYQSFLEDGLV